MKKENKQLARERRAKERQQKKNLKVLSYVLYAAIAIGLVIGLIVLMKKAPDPTGNTSAITGNTSSVSLKEYSKYLNDDGTIKGINISDYVTLGDLSAVEKVDTASLVPSDEDVDAKVRSNLSSYTTLVEDEGIVVEMGDTIRLDYVGTVDGVAFEGGSTDGNGTSLTLGSGSYIDDFEEQLAGHKVGEDVTVNVTFPETYTNNPDMAGKEAVFECHINGRYELILNDELMTTANTGYETLDAYKESVAAGLYREALESAVWTAVDENTEISTVPEDYYANLVTMQQYSMQTNYEYYAQAYASLLGYNPWSSIEEFYGASSEELAQYVASVTVTDAVYTMVCQAIYEKEGLTVTEDDMMAFCRNMGYTGDDMTEVTDTYGKAFINQGGIGVCVLNYLVEKAENANH